ncbi:hypothetical protein NLJ89_g8649 [Agrocybe chaxingu]|uniref:Uncharacterized protein n=1 Tax=Agrocybe chaxingu TaxID=84603 RepID=A0A9W8JS96_9AGAR|nr:hypothetical protein NLJ89_g8649 [Agrocybe chaxingu]
MHNNGYESATLVVSDNSYPPHSLECPTSKSILALSYSALALAIAALAAAVVSRIKTNQDDVKFIFTGLGLLADILAITVGCITVFFAVLAIVAQQREASSPKTSLPGAPHRIYLVSAGGLWAAWAGVVSLNGMAISAKFPPEKCSLVQGLNTCKAVGKPGISYPHLITAAIALVEVVVLFVIARLTAHRAKQATNAEYEGAR